MSALRIIIRRIVRNFRPPATEAKPAPVAPAPLRPPLPPSLRRSPRQRDGVLPVRDITHDERERTNYLRQGLFLARQERWDELDALIRETDAVRAATPGGETVAELLARGAVTDALEPGLDGTPGAGIPWLHDLLRERPERPGIALTVALAEIATAETARGDAEPGELGVAQRMDFFAHLAQAAQVLDPFDPIELDSPALAAARCAVAPVWRADAGHVADLYEDLIDLDPANPRHMRALGRALRPRGLGAFTELDRVACATAERTADIWGAGGYVWCWRDVLLADPRGFERLELARFMQGIEDILLRHEDQHLLNQLAAFCALAPGHRGRGQAEMNAAIAPRRQAVREAGLRILRDHMTEIHPLVWAEASGHRGDRPAAIEAGATLACAALEAAAAAALPRAG
jgi:hypothetical protein